MANNTVLNAGSGGDTIQTVDNTTYKTPVTVLANSTGTLYASITPNNSLQTTPVSTFGTGTIAALNGTVSTTTGGGTIIFTLSGTSTQTVIVQGTVDGTNFVTLNFRTVATGGGAAVSSLAYTGTTATYAVYAAGWKSIRFTNSAYTSGTLTVAWSQSLDVITDNISPPTQVVGGATSIGAATAGAPVYIGGLAVVGANPTAVANAQRSGITTDKVGRQIVVNGHERTMTGVQQTTITSSVVETTIVTAVAATFLDLTHLSITNGSATATIVTLKDATAGTTRGIWNLSAGGGVVLSFPTPLAQATVNNNWTITCGTSVASVYVVAQFVKNI